MSVHVAGRVLVADPRDIVRGGPPRGRQPAARRSSSGWPSSRCSCGIGAIGALLTLPPGWEVLGTSPSFEWGILITAYVFFAITTSGLCLASSLGTVFGIRMFLPLEKRHAILAVLCLVTAFGIIALDLHYPVRLVFGAFLSPSPFSPMWWMGVFYGVYLVFLLTEVASMFTGRWRVHRVACTLSSITAVFAPLTLGCRVRRARRAPVLARPRDAAVHDRVGLPVRHRAAGDRLLLRLPLPAGRLGADPDPHHPGAADPPDGGPRGREPAGGAQGGRRPRQHERLGGGRGTGGGDRPAGPAVLDLQGGPRARRAAGRCWSCRGPGRRSACWPPRSAPSSACSPIGSSS